MQANILIVEDHNAVRKALKDLLEIEYPEFKFSEATCGEEAIKLIDLESPDLIVMDMMLPGMNGIDSARMIRAVRRSMKIVILGMQEDQIYREAAEKAGVSAFILKQEIPAELIPAVNRLLNNGGKRV